MDANTAKPKEKIVKSSLLTAYTYDATAYTLDVTFKDGAEWRYTGVTPDVMSSVFDGPKSIGSQFVRHIVRGNYKGVKTS